MIMTCEDGVSRFMPSSTPWTVLHEGCTVELYNLQLINGRPPLDANGRPVPDAFPWWYNFPGTGFARARPPPAVRRPLSAAL